jgi:hypothetical protein
MHLFIVGLRRSGTTIFWRTIRQDERFTCYDEPFSGQLRDLPNEHHKRIWGEYIRLIDVDRESFWEHYVDIPPAEELDSGFTSTQRTYLEWLLETHSNVAIDFTRCNFKLEALNRLAPGAVVVHLHRPAASFATSHILGGRRSDVRGRLRYNALKSTFWSRKSGYDRWNIETIIGHDPNSVFGERLNAASLPAAEIYQMPAVAKLLAYWRINHEQVETVGRKLLGDRFVSVRFDDFCARPIDELQRVYDAIGLDLPRFDASTIHAPHGAYRPADPRWITHGRPLGLDSSQLFG